MVEGRTVQSSTCAKIEVEGTIYEFCFAKKYDTPLGLRSGIRLMSSIQPICKCRCPRLPVSHSPVLWTWYGFFANLRFCCLVSDVNCIVLSSNIKEKMIAITDSHPINSEEEVCDTRSTTADKLAQKTKEISWNLWKNMLVGSEKRKPLDLHSVYITSLCAPLPSLAVTFVLSTPLAVNFRL